jgi:hypothetical protein
MKFGEEQENRLIRKEENMEEKEYLLEELRKWTVEYEKAREAFNELLPNPVDVSLGEKLGRIVITEELLDKYDEAEKRMDDALAKRREVMEKLRELGAN